MADVNRQRTDASPSNDSVVEIFASRDQRSQKCSGTGSAESNSRSVRGRTKSHRSSSLGSSSFSGQSLSQRRTSSRGRSLSRRRSISRGKSLSRRGTSSRRRSSSRGKSLSRRRSSSRGSSFSLRRSSSRGRSLSRRRSPSRGRSCSRRSSSSPHKLERDGSRVSCKRRRRSDNRAATHFGKRNKSFSRRSYRHDFDSPERKYIYSRRSRSRMRNRSKSNTHTKSRDYYDDGKRSSSGRNSESSASTRFRNEPDASAANSQAPLLPPPLFKFETPLELRGSVFDLDSSSNQFPIRVFNRNNSPDQDGPTLSQLANVVSSKNGNRVSATMQGRGTIPLVLNVGNSVANEISPNNLIQKYTISVQKDIPGYHHGKHPIRELDEQCERHGWLSPRYEENMEHGEHFFQVKVNGEWYHPKEGSTSPRDAKLLAAVYCLQQLGILA